MNHFFGKSQVYRQVTKLPTAHTPIFRSLPSLSYEAPLLQPFHRAESLQTFDSECRILTAQLYSPFQKIPISVFPSKTGP